MMEVAFRKLNKKCSNLTPYRNYMTKKRIPQIKLIKTKRKYGKALFKGSSIRELEFNILICHDMNLILNMKVVDK